MNSCLTSFLLFDKCMSETESCVLCVSVHFPFWCIPLKRYITHEILIKFLCQTCVLVWTVLLCSYWIRLATILLQPHAIPAKDNKSENKKSLGSSTIVFSLVFTKTWCDQDPFLKTSIKLHQLLDIWCVFTWLVLEVAGSSAHISLDILATPLSFLSIEWSYQQRDHK